MRDKVSRAAEVLNVQRSHMSRVVVQLEAQLDVKLIERTTREFGLMAVSLWVNEYLERHAKVACEVEYDSPLIDLVHEGFDLAIRVGELEDSGLAARRLGTRDYGLYASPTYVARHGRPSSLADSQGHALLMFNAGAQRAGWMLHHGSETIRIEGPARLRTNNSFALRHALLQHMSNAQLPTIVAEESVKAKRMVRVLPGWAREPVPVHAVFPNNRYVAPKLRAFIDLAVERFPQVTK